MTPSFFNTLNISYLGKFMKLGTNYPVIDIYYFLFRFEHGLFGWNHMPILVKADVVTFLERLTLDCSAH
jgi:hypothetical protein